MKNYSNKVILVITVLSLIGMIGNMAEISSEMRSEHDEMQTPVRKKSLMPNSAISHAPIFIDGDNPAYDWDDCDAVTGSGTLEDPYVIEDLEIDAEGSASGIFILDSTAYLNIDNCTVINSGGFPHKGINVEYCENINISNCNVSFNSGYGIFLYKSNFNTLICNTVANNSNDGIYFYDSSNNTLTGNTIANNLGNGIILERSSDNTLTGNTVANNLECGIFLYISNYNTLICNTVANNLGCGVILLDSSNNTLTGNTVANNLEYGIQLHNSTNNTLTGNTVANNLGCGVYLTYSSDYNTIWQNCFLNNDVVQAFSINSNDNLWDWNGQGNYWSDYEIRYPEATSTGGIWGTPYEIAPSVFDHYPLVKVIDNVLPTWNDAPTDQIMEVGESFLYDVSASDNVAIETYWLSETSLFQIDSNGLITNTTDLLVGTYYLTIYVNDTSGNVISAEITIEVQDTTTDDEPTDDEPTDDDTSGGSIPSYSFELLLGTLGLGSILLLFILKKRKLN